MKSNFELGDEQPRVPTVNTPRKKSGRPSSKQIKNETIEKIELAKGLGLYEDKNFCAPTKSSEKIAEFGSLMKKWRKSPWSKKGGIRYYMYIYSTA